MSLENQIKEILDNFDNTPSEKIFETLEQIMPFFKSDLISEYLQGKIVKIKNSSDESEIKTQCKTLTPYFDWYLQGL